MQSGAWAVVVIDRTVLGGVAGVLDALVEHVGDGLVGRLVACW
jgi:hypothetical protein